MKKIMLIGAVDSGKTSLLMALNGEHGCASKTQTLEYTSLSIDTPGEYIENPRMYKALLCTAMEAKCILFTQDSTARNSIFPPGFARTFNRITVGVITKTDDKRSDTEAARKFLKQLGLNGPIFEVSAHTGSGVDTINDYIKSLV